MPTAEAATPKPTYGIPSASKSPWRTPSSPNVPWTIGKTTSGRPAAYAFTNDSTIRGPGAADEPGFTPSRRRSRFGRASCRFISKAESSGPWKRPSFPTKSGTAS